MTAFSLLLHIANFMLPALAIALVLALVPRLIRRKRRPGEPAWWVQAAGVFAAGVAVLVAGLVIGGRDGRMSTYVALVLVCGSTQWLLARGFKS